ncbi:MAG: hypothetical protein RIS84_1472 [Pseudomonadota bacterium]|jgi:hypothetical protein
MSIYNIYCDESCHLENDHLKVMSLGAIVCERNKVHQLSEQIRQLKTQHGLSRQFEIKWSKVSPAKLDFYAELIKLFFNNSTLQFGGMVIPDKSLLKHEKFSQNHNDFYYKMFFNLLKPIFDKNHQYAIYLDIKDTQSQALVQGLHDKLCGSLADVNHENIQRIQQIRSHESELLQLTDLLTGALSYLYRDLQTSTAKKALIEQINNLSGSTLMGSDVHFTDKKFSLLIWQAQDGTA